MKMKRVVWWKITRDGSFRVEIQSAIYEARSKAGTMTLENTLFTIKGIQEKKKQMAGRGEGIR